MCSSPAPRLRDKHQCGRRAVQHAGMRLGPVAVLAVGLSSVGGCLGWSGGDDATGDDGIHRIKHVIVIIQENRSFDSYSARFPGAEGLSGIERRFSVCLPDPAPAAAPTRTTTPIR